MKSDAQLQRDILNELEWEPRVEASRFGVTAHEGVVTLMGHVPVYAEKHLAEEVCKRVHGVRAVANEVEVRPDEVHMRDDEDIATAALHALEWDVQVPADRLQITVTEGWITVDGEVEEPYQRTEVDRVLRHLAGARGITNTIDIVHREVHGVTREHIEAAFRRSATLDSRSIAVEVDERTVILTGDVHSHCELEEAERIAWTARGVRDVQNCITITPWGTGPAEEWGY